MQTTINNNLRVYQIVTSTGSQVFCNITDMNNIISELNAREGYFKVYHFWNNKPEYLTRKKLDILFEGSQLKREFNY